MSYTYAKRPFYPVLTGEENWAEFILSCEDYMREKEYGLWEVANGSDALSTGATPAETERWNKLNSTAIGIFRGNVSEHIKAKLRTKDTCVAMHALCTDEYGARRAEQAHIILNQLQTLKFLDGDDFSQFLETFEGKANKLAAMGAPVEDPQLLTALKIAMPPSFQNSTIRSFNVQPETVQTYQTLRRILIADALTNQTANADVRAFHTSGTAPPGFVMPQLSSTHFTTLPHGLPPAPPTHSAPPAARTYAATASVYLFTRDDGKLCTNDGKVVDCRTCGENHTQRDCPRTPIDVQDPSSRGGSGATSSSGAPPGSGPNWGANRAKRDRRKANKANGTSAGTGTSAATPLMFFTRGANALSTSFRTSARQFEEGEFDESPLLLLDTASNINLVQRQNSLAPGTIYSKETVIEGVKEGEMLVAQVAGTLPIRTTNGVHLSLGETVQADGASANIISLQRLADRGAIITLNSTGGSIKLPGAPNLLPVGREQGFWTLKHVPAPGQGKSHTLDPRRKT